MMELSETVGLAGDREYYTDGHNPRFHDGEPEGAEVIDAILGHGFHGLRKGCQRRVTVTISVETS